MFCSEASERWGSDPLPVFVAPRGIARRHGDDGNIPLQILTPNTKNRIHSQFGNLPSIRALDPKPLVQLSPPDADAAESPTATACGSSTTAAASRSRQAIDHSLRPGCVVVHNGWWLSEGGGINRLSAARETDMGHGAAFHDNAVEVERLG